MASVFRRCFSWVLRPFWRPIEKMIERRVGPLETEALQKLTKLDAQAEIIEQMLYQRAGTLEGRVDTLEERIGQLQTAVHRLEKGWRHHGPAFMSGLSNLVQLEQDVRILRQDIRNTHHENQNRVTRA